MPFLDLKLYAPKKDSIDFLTVSEANFASSLNGFVPLK